MNLPHCSSLSNFLPVPGRLCLDDALLGCTSVSFSWEPLWRLSERADALRSFPPNLLNTPPSFCSLGLGEGGLFCLVATRDLKDTAIGDGLRERLFPCLVLGGCVLDAELIPFVVKVNESLGLIEYYIQGEMWVCGVWMRKDGVDKPFTKIYTVKVEGKSVLYRVLGFRNNGEVLLQLDDDDFEGSQIKVYEPSSGRINSVGISGERLTFTAWSYMETLLLLDESNSIIH
ncbi:hypothetical protein Tco_1475931 [Tanacetum coccineum]